ncbi:MAG TPA: insulinase family protein, partial [Blastocatellia bacterium]|nr:insulinase family protein [Blastocatellia bacterium]
IERLFATAFTANRLKRGSSVSESMLSAVTREQALAFYQNFYHPANTIVTVVGDVFSIQALGQIQLQFGGYQKVGAPAPAAKSGAAGRPGSAAAAAATEPAPPAQSPYASNPEEPAQDKLHYANSRADIGLSIVTIGYRTPAFKPDKDGLKETATLEMLSAALGLGNSSRLWQGLREGQASRDKNSVATEIGVTHYYLSGTGMLIAKLRVDSERIDRAEAEYFREIERFRRELISDGELQRARIMLEKRYYDVLGRVETEVDALARHQARFGDYRLFDSILARVQSVTAADVQQAAAKYLSLADATVHEYEPRTAQARTFTAEKFAELIATFAPGTVQPIKPEEVKPAVPLKTFAQGAERAIASDGQNIIVASVPVPIKDFSVLRGPRAYVREDRALPKLSVSLLFQGGRLIEDQTTSGTTELMLRMMLKSTTARKADLIALELESYGAEIKIVNDPDLFGFTLDVLSRNAENAIKLLLEIVESPYFDKDELGKERSAVLAQQIQQRDNDLARSIDLTWASLYPGHPYGLPRYGLPDPVKAATEEKLEAWYAKTIKKQYPLVVLVGDTDGSALVSRIFSEGLKRDEMDKSLKVNLPTVAQPQEQIERRVRRLTVQTLGFRVLNQPNAQSNDLLAISMLGNIATSGKLADEMRDKQGIPGGASIRIEQQLASGAIFAQFATLPENEQSAREAAQGELLRLAGTLPSDDEFEQGRNATIGRYAIALQSHPDRALEYARTIIQGRKATDVESQPDFIRSVKKADIKRVAESLIKANQIGRGVVRGEGAPAAPTNVSEKN